MDTAKIEALAFRVVGDMGGAFTMALGYIGDRLGLFKAMAGAGPLTSVQLAKKTKLNERYVREWLRAMVASEYLDFDPGAGTFRMTEEQAQVLTNEDFPFFVGGALQFTVPSIANAGRLLTHFKRGGGIPYSKIGREVPEAIARFFRPGYLNFLTAEWLPKVPGLVDRLRAGGRIADVGCGFGESSVQMARAWPASTVVGIDNDAASIRRARKLAAARQAKNATFVAAPAARVRKLAPFDLVCSFDCIHDMVDPRGALRAIRSALAPDGVYVWSEPNASEEPLRNRNPLGKVFCNISPLHCMTVSLAHGGEGLGTVIGESGARALAQDAGFGRFEKLAIDNPFNQFFALRR